MTQVPSSLFVAMDPPWSDSGYGSDSRQSPSPDDDDLRSERRSRSSSKDLCQSYNVDIRFSRSEVAPSAICQLRDAILSDLQRSWELEVVKANMKLRELLQFADDPFSRDFERDHFISGILGEP
ncbi:hypothetical protein EX30DRAFT_337590 [Ascodesmis nigricans]|uniref:Uncharacterized protein n=1 Tax=Ascodesmis nigricans TaxID=341454 RepID=A0A4S2N7B6_9PEZI|nr:hypothetical protein EX30DRAFT_337590 [Ascodesmis nigricans]